MTAQNECCCFFSLRDYLAGYVKFYSQGSTIIYLEDSFYRLVDTIKLFQLTVASLLLLVLMTLCNKQFHSMHDIVRSEQQWNLAGLSSSKFTKIFLQTCTMHVTQSWVSTNIFHNFLLFFRNFFCSLSDLFSLLELHYWTCIVTHLIAKTKYWQPWLCNK